MAVILAAIGFSTSGSEATLPEPVEAIFPLPGDSVIPQQGVLVDMKVGYSIVIRVDGVVIPQAEIRLVEPTGTSTWQPDEGHAVETWLPGDHTVVISWDRVTGLPDRGSFSWTFRVQ